MRRASSGEDSELEKTSATKSMSLGTWIVTMKGCCLPLRLKRAPGGAIQPPCEFAIGCTGVLAKNRLHVHGRGRCPTPRRHAKAPWHHAVLHSNWRKSAPV